MVLQSLKGSQRSRSEGKQLPQVVREVVQVQVNQDHLELQGNDMHARSNLIHLNCKD